MTSRIAFSASSPARRGARRPFRPMVGALAALLALAAGVQAATLFVEISPTPPPQMGNVTIIYNGVPYMTSATNSTLSITIPDGTNVSAIASPGVGYTFESWSLLFGSATIASPTSGVTAINGITGFTFIRATFRAPQRRLGLFSTPVAGGTTLPFYNEIRSVDQNSSVAIAAVPNANYVFWRWLNGPVANDQANPTTVYMDQDKTNVTAQFRRTYTLTAYHDDGPSDPSPFTTNLVQGQSYRVQIPPEDRILYAGADTRYVLNGWASGTGNINPVSGSGAYVDIENVTMDSSLDWQWQTQYRLQTAYNTGGSVFPDGDTWQVGGASVDITATPDEGYFLSGWTVNGVPVANVTLTLTITMTGPTVVIARFGQRGSDSDGDGLPDDWEILFGLDPGDNGSRNINNGKFGDPDRDGLYNIQEYMISDTNLFLYCNPVKADSDGDGMDDYFETFRLAETNPTIVAEGLILPAAIDNGDRFIRNGPLGNPDSDVKWNTATGYIMSNAPLSNIEEWRGPDNRPPCTYQVLNFGDAGYPFFDNGGNYRPAVTVRVLNNVGPLADTSDQSHPLEQDSDYDGFLDGFEYSWDIWQQANQGTPICNLSYTNYWPDITDVVPDWASAREFNPNIVFAGGEGVPYPDYDRWYDQITGQPGNYFDSYAEARVSEFAEGPDTLFPVVRRFPPPGNPAWCSNPFMWDTDGDGLPDGWEVSYGFDPWSPDSDIDGVRDGNENPDGDWYADDGAGSKHYQVYVLYGFHPMTGYNYMPPAIEQGHPNTVQYDNLQELIGDGVAPDFPGLTNGAPARPTNPHLIDSDVDGIWDGWEFYMGMNPQDPLDAGLDDAPGDQDGLINLDEFRSYNTTTNIMGARWNLPEWLNKLQPTDIWDPDTDYDQLGDGGERVAFNYVGATTQVFTVVDELTSEILYYQFSGGGLNPCTFDTDRDQLPDAWEAQFPGAEDAATATWGGGMNGTVSDYDLDYDGDGLLNYQEYMIGAVYAWQPYFNGGAPAWTPGRGIYNYEPYDFFDPVQSSNQWFTGPGGRAPKVWDPNGVMGPIYHLVDVRFMTAAEHLTGLWFSSSDPQLRDTDEDGMDDYWEVYHGLNPLFGMIDIVYSKLYGMVIGVPGVPEHIMSWIPNMDVRVFPWMSGYPVNDPDQDEIPNIFESVSENAPVPPYHHSDPSPLWMTDVSSEESVVNLYYWLGLRFGDAYEWYWSPEVIFLVADPPSYMFSFEINEGFDTDNDNLADKAEIGSDPYSLGSTDPINSQSPIKRRALYLNGDAAARTRLDHVHLQDDFRTFTAQMWAKPENPASGQDQILIERTAFITQGGLMGGLPLTSVRLANFRIGVKPDGRPYAGYNGSGAPYIFVETVAPASVTLKTNEWAHLATTYDGRYLANGHWAGMLRLYLNGALVASTPSSEIPCNGWFGSLSAGTNGVVNSGYYFPMPIVVGAGDDNPSGWIDAGPIVVGPYRPGMFVAPQLGSYFQGWVDKIEVWTGARTQGQITEMMRKRMDRREARQYFDESGLRYYYTFDDLPDPDHSPVAPVGYNLLNGRPAGYFNVPWWGNAPYRSLRYDDYTYIPWIENLVVHAALYTPRDTTIPHSTPPVTNIVGGVTNVVPGVSNIYPNTSNPYGFVYTYGPNANEERHPQLSAGSGLMDDLVALETLAYYSDMLPLQWAEADEDVAMWDGGGVPATEPYDSDGDGLPDDWEESNGLDPLAVGGIDGAFGDIDGDGLVNLYEYLCYTDPNNTDTDGDGIGDLDEDFDGDGLSNREELFVYGTHPAFMDTDDDGYTNMMDRIEVQAGHRASDSLSPYFQRSLECFGSSTAPVQIAESTLDEDDREAFNISEWTIEGHVNLRSYPVSRARMIQRVAAVGTSRPVNYELGVDSAGLPYALFQTSNGESVEVKGSAAHPLAIGTWYHLAARLNEGVLALFVDGRLAAQTLTSLLGAVDSTTDEHGAVNLGAGLDGFMDELRIWSVTRSDDEILAHYNSTLLFMAEGYGVLSVGGGGDRMEEAGLGLVENLSNQWTVSTWFKLEPGTAAGILVARRAPTTMGNGTWRGDPGMTLQNGLFNYYLGVDDQGRVVGLHTYWYWYDTGIEWVEAFADNRLTSLRDVRDGEWHHAAYVWNGTSFYLYVDGLRHAVGSLPAYAEESFLTGNGNLVVGEGISGTIDETRIHNYAMSAQLLNLTRVAPASLIDPGLVSYFNYDFTGGGFIVDDLSPQRDPEEFGILADGAEILENVNVPQVNISPLQSYEGVMSGYWVFDDGGRFAENMMMRNYLVSSERDYGFEPLGGLVTNLNPMLPGLTWNAPSRFADRTGFETDSDGDGLPDWWEVLYHLLPNRDDGEDGPYGDPDKDGLVNLYEYRSGTNPRIYDTDGDGFNDFDSWSGTVYRTFGETWSDMDEVPDEWEEQYRMYGLSPQDYDAASDPDIDGWSNLQEWWADTVPNLTSNYPSAFLSGNAIYAGAAGGAAIEIEGYQTIGMDEGPVARTNTTASDGAFTITGFKEGDAYLFGFLDRSGDGLWSVDEPAGILQNQPYPSTMGSQFGLKIGIWDQANVPWYPRLSWAPQPGAVRYFMRLYYTGVGKTLILTKWINADRTTFHDWDYQTATYVSGNWFYGLTTGNYEWQIARDSGSGILSIFGGGTFHVTSWGPPTPTPVYPIGGGEVVRAKDEFRWTMPANAAGFALRLTGPDGTVLERQFPTAPKTAGVYSQPFPVLFGDGVWTNGLYQWRIRINCDGSWSSWSAPQLFRVNLSAPGVGMARIAGDLVYFGKATGAANIDRLVVEAFRSKGFGGYPDARVVVSYTCNTNAPTYLKGNYALQGLPHGVYYVRAYIDINANGAFDVWEPHGFVSDGYYRPKALDTAGTPSMVGQRLIIRDRDTDNDGLPDSWEWFHFGTLAYAAESDSDFDGLTMLQEYVDTLYDSDPSKADSDGDGLYDGWNDLNRNGRWDPGEPLGELAYGTSATNPDSDGDGVKDGLEAQLGLNPMSRDTDGDGMPDGAELAAGTDARNGSDFLAVRPLDEALKAAATGLEWEGKANVVYQVEVSSDLSGWQDAPAAEGGRVTGTGTHRYQETTPVGPTRFYRVRVVTP